MPIKIKSNLKFLKVYPRNLKKNFSRELQRDLADIVVEHITSGKSPVRGKRFQQYSKEYAKKKGRRRPVDLLDTGAMLESIFVRRDRNNNTVIGFRSRIAAFHDKTGRVIRRLLPKRGERFARKVESKIIALLKKAVRKTRRR